MSSTNGKREESLFVRTLDEVAAMLGCSRSQVQLDQESALRKIREAILADPVWTHTIAHEPTEKEVEECFRSMPWCHYIVLPGGRILHRRLWLEELERRNRTYQIT